MRNKKQRAHRYGIVAEYVAAGYLMCKGYRILKLRYRNPKGEIDILASKKDMLVAVEVKARGNFAACENAIAPAKQKQVQRSLEWLMMDPSKIAGLDLNKTPNIRLDVIWVVPKSWPKHIQDAWRI